MTGKAEHSHVIATLSPGPPEVTVIIPAFNADRWLARTLASAQHQTVENIEIIIVDDGSTDQTTAIAKTHIDSDARIILLRQQNRGVAAARNLGLQRARARYVAMLDADDLWHPRRLEFHLQAFANSDDALAMVFSPYRSIDAADLVIGGNKIVRWPEEAFIHFLYANPVGNGSGITVRTDAARAVGGYSSALRAQGAEGAEDRLLQQQLAMRYKTRCVGKFLIGYRTTDDSMSMKKVQMARSRLLALEELASSAPETSAAVFWAPRLLAQANLVSHLATSPPYRRDVLSYGVAHPLACLVAILNAGLRFIAKLKRRPKAIKTSQRSFHAFEP